MRSAWLANAEQTNSVRSNGRQPVNVGTLVGGWIGLLCCDRWAYDLLYAPLTYLEAYPNRAVKYFGATVMTIHLMSEAFRGSVAATRYLHRFAALTCYLDAVVDASESVQWPLAFGMAVFGMTSQPPPFLDGHTSEFRTTLERDYPRLRLCVGGDAQQKHIIVDSLLKAAAVEGIKREVEPFEYKVLSNLMCIRPYFRQSGHVDDRLIEPMAVFYTYFDDAFDVIEDTEQGCEPSMGTESGLRRAKGLAKEALSQINAELSTDWAWIMELATELAGQASLAQIQRPDEYVALMDMTERSVAVIAVSCLALLT